MSFVGVTSQICEIYELLTDSGACNYAYIIPSIIVLKESAYGVFLNNMSTVSIYHLSLWLGSFAWSCCSNQCFMAC